MYKIKFRERHFLDKYRCIDYIKEIVAYSFFEQGSQIYYKLDRFNYKVISKEDIIEQINL